jgi:uncharacterized membrane protein YbhN (UPF0104 family)
LVRDHQPQAGGAGQAKPGRQDRSGEVAAAGLENGGLLALPLFALPVILIGAPVNRGLENAAFLGAAGFVAFAAFGAVVLAYDAPLRWAGRTAQRRATGSHPRPSVIVVAYAVAGVVGMIPATPGGLGLVEASLTGLLVLAEVNSSQAVLATLTYRIASYWVPLCAGPVAYGLFKIRYRKRAVTPAAAGG